LLASALALLLLAAPAGAGTISLSDMSSEQEEGGTPPEVLTADLTFTVVGNTLTLDVDNLSNYDIAELYFNSTSDITSLTLDQPPTDADWLLIGPQSVSSFGTFDHHVSVQGSINQSSATILSGTSQTLQFTLDCAGGATCDMADFIVNNDGGKAVAAKFQRGGEVFDDNFPGGDDSAIGASPVPEPGTAALLGLGLVALARVGRSR
jgi:hypothetical protein